MEAIIDTTTNNSYASFSALCDCNFTGNESEGYTSNTFYNESTLDYIDYTGNYSYFFESIKIKGSSNDYGVSQLPFYGIVD